MVAWFYCRKKSSRHEIVARFYCPKTVETIYPVRRNFRIRTESAVTLEKWETEKNPSAVTLEKLANQARIVLYNGVPNKHYWARWLLELSLN